MKDPSLAAHPLLFLALLGICWIVCVALWLLGVVIVGKVLDHCGAEDDGLFP